MSEISLVCAESKAGGTGEVVPGEQRQSRLRSETLSDLSGKHTLNPSRGYDLVTVTQDCILILNIVRRSFFLPVRVPIGGRCYSFNDGAPHSNLSTGFSADPHVLRSRRRETPKDIYCTMMKRVETREGV